MKGNCPDCPAQINLKLTTQNQNLIGLLASQYFFVREVPWISGSIKWSLNVNRKILWKSYSLVLPSHMEISYTLIYFMMTFSYEFWQRHPNLTFVHVTQDLDKNQTIENSVKVCFLFALLTTSLTMQYFFKVLLKYGFMSMKRSITFWA